MKNKKLWIAGSYLLAFVFGVMFGVQPVEPQIKEVTKEVEKIVYQTPQVCKDLIYTDNKIFTYLGEKLPTMEFDSIANYVEGITPQRLQQASDCLGS